MSDRDPQLSQLLERAYPAPADQDWLDVLRRAQEPESFQMRLRVRLTRRVLTPAIGGAVLVVLLAAVALVGPSGDERPTSIVQRAQAAVGDGPILHVVFRERTVTGERYETATGRPVPVVTLVETWADPERGRGREIRRRGGTVVSDVAYTGLPGPARGPLDLAAQYRRQLEKGQTELVRAGVVNGRPVHWLRFTGARTVEWAVDARTYQLVRVRSVAGPVRNVQDYLTMEAVERDEDDFEVEHAAPRAIRQSRPPGTRTGPAGALRAVEQAQWAGLRLAGLPLRELRVMPWRGTLDPDAATGVVKPDGDERDVEGTILIVAYGERLSSLEAPVEGMPTGVEIVQAADEDEARHFLRPGREAYPPPPEGSFDLSAEDLGAGALHATGSLRKPGVWILIRASSRELLFEAARSLRPIPSR